MRAAAADLNEFSLGSWETEVAAANAAAPLVRPEPLPVVGSRQVAEADEKATKLNTGARPSHVGCQQVLEWSSMLWPMLLTNMFIMCRGYMEVPVVNESKYIADLSDAFLLLAPTSVLIGGLASPLVTFCSSALGAGNLRLCGIWLQMALLMQTLSFILMAPTFWFGGDLMTIVMGDQADTERVNIFSRTSLFSSWASVWSLSLTSFLMAHQQLMPALFAASVALVVAFIWRSFLSSWTWTFLDGPHANFTDVWAPFACNLAQLVSIWLLSQVGGSLPDIQPGIHWLFCLEGNRVVTYLRMAVPMILLVAVENGKLQNIMNLCSQMGDVTMATQDLVIRCFLGFAATFSPLIGVTQAMVSRQLGHGDANMACDIVWYIVAPSCALVIVTVICCAYLVQTRDVWISSQPEVQQGVTEVVPFLTVACCLITVLYAGVGVLSACARVFWILMSFLIGAWSVTIPLAWYFVFFAPPCRLVRWTTFSHVEAHGIIPEHKCRLLGIWLAICAGYFVTIVLITIGVLRSDWTALAKEARQRSEVEVPNALKAVEEVELVQMHKEAVGVRYLSGIVKSYQDQDHLGYVQVTHWRCEPANGHPIAIRKEPDINSPDHQMLIHPGVVFRVCQELQGADGVLYLQLANGGWVFDRKPEAGVMCVRAEAFEMYKVQQLGDSSDSEVDAPTLREPEIYGGRREFRRAS